MTLTEVNLPQIEKCLYLLPISDLHIGSGQFNRKKLESYLEWFYEYPNSRFFLNGDVFNCGTKHSVRNVHAEKMPLHTCKEVFYEIFEPYQQHCLGWVDGNHEEQIYKDTGDLIGKDVCRQMNWPYFGVEMYLKLRFGKRENQKPFVYVLYATHGFGGGRKNGTALNKIEDLRLICLADIYVASHHHHQVASQNLYYVPDLRNNKVDERKITYCGSGTFKDIGRWEKTKGMSPPKIGSPRLRLDATRKDCHISL